MLPRRPTRQNEVIIIMLRVRTVHAIGTSRVRDWQMVTKSKFWNRHLPRNRTPGVIPCCPAEVHTVLGSYPHKLWAKDCHLFSVVGHIAPHALGIQTHQLGPDDRVKKAHPTTDRSMVMVARSRSCPRDSHPQRRDFAPDSRR